MTTRLEQIKARLEKATPGPWAWRKTDKKSNTWGWGWHLVAPHTGLLYVMDFVRNGMSGAEPRFAERGKDANGRWQGGILSTFEQVGDRLLPDADLIAHAPDDLAALILIAEAAERWEEVRRKYINATYDQMTGNNAPLSYEQARQHEVRRIETERLAETLAAAVRAFRKGGGEG